MFEPRIAGFRFVVVAALSFITLARSSFSQTCDAPFMGGSSANSTLGVEPREIAVADFNHDGILDLAVQHVTSPTVSIMRGSPVGFSVLTNHAFVLIGSTADVVAADFDHNGWADILVSAPTDNEVALVLRDDFGNFLPEQTIGVGPGPTALATGDFDSDGHVDIAVYNSADLPLPTVNVLLGDGGGGFTPQTAFAMTVKEEMVAADLDRDGDLDLVATDEAADGIVVALGKDDGNFVAPTAIPGAGDGPISLVVADFNRDGVLDVVTNNSVSRDIEYYRGDGIGGFSASGRVSASISVAARIATGDVDGNGTLDVVLSDKGSAAIDVFLGGGAGTFTGPFTEIAVWETFGIAVEDFDRDGRDDLAVGYITKDQVGLMNSRLGLPCPNVSFGRVGHYLSVGADSAAIVPGDFDRDGSLDFVSLSGSQNSITRWLGRGIGQFQSPDTRLTGSLPVSMDGADFDSDGDRDIVTASGGAAVLIVHENSLGSFISTTPYSLGAVPRQVVAADVSFDGKVDLVVSLAANNVLVGLNDGSGNFPSFVPFAVGLSPGPIAVGDFNNDSLADIAAGEANAKRIVLLRNVGGGSFANAGFFALVEAPTAIQAAHLNGDGNLDLAIAFGAGGTGTLVTRTGDGAFGFSPGASVSIVGGPASPHGLAVADFDLDGNKDVAVADMDLFRVHVLPGDGSGGFGTPRVEPTPQGPYALATGDYDRDGAPDLLVGLWLTNRVVYLPGNGLGSFSPGFFPALSFDTRAPATGDVDRDGRLDVVVANFDTHSVSPFLGFANGNFGPAGGPYSILPQRGPRWVTVDDFDDDGNPDILASAGGDGYLVFLGGGLGYPTKVATSIGGSPYISRAADFDFDGRLDIAVLNGFNVETYRGNGLGGFITVPLTLPIGGDGTGLAVGDFNRDGYIDVAATQSTDDQFYLYFGNGPGSWDPVALQLGPGRDPMDFDVADFDGNGFVDFAIPLKGDDKVRLIVEDGGGSWMLGGTFTTPNEPVSLRAPDVNRDGKSDLIVASKSDHVLAFFLGDGTGSFGTATWATVGVRGPTGLAVGDFDADGAPDLAVVPDSANYQTPAGFASVVNTNCRPRLFDFLSDVSTCDLPGSAFSSQPSLKVIDDGENLIQCELRPLLAGIVPGTGTGGAFLLGTPSVTPAPSTGVYTYSNLGVNLAGGGYQLQFTHEEARDKRSRTFSQLLPVSITGPNLLCQGDPAVYSTEPGNDMYSWFVDSNPVSMAPAIDLTSYFTPNPGLHPIDVSVERDSCGASTLLNVDVTASLTAFDIAPLGPLSVCESCTGSVATATPTGGGASMYQWGFRTASGPAEPITFFSGETNPTYVIEGTDFPGPGTYFLVASADPTCGPDLVSNEVTVDVIAATAQPLVAFTALSTSGQNYLEWATPATPCTGVRILRRDDGVFPTDPGDSSAIWVSGADFPCAPDTKGFFPDTTGIANDVKYYYSAWVQNGGSDSLRRTLKARPFDHTAGKVKWAYSTGATAMAQAGIRILAGVSSLYVVSNDGRVHGLVGGSTGGQWLSAARPAAMTLPSQTRPPVVPFLVGTIPNEAPNGAAFVASQDGKVYVLDADDLGPVWTTNVAESLQAGAAGIFAAFGSTKDWILIGTKNTVGPNGFQAVNVSDGTLDWFFENTVPQGGDGSPMGVILGGAGVDYAAERVFFGSWKGGGTSTLWALDFSGGTAVKDWSLDIGDVEASPVYLGGPSGKLVVGTKNSRIHLLDANNGGNSLWTGFYNASDGAVKGFVFPHFHAGTTNFMFSTTSKVTSIRDNGVGTTPTMNWEITGIPIPSVPIHLPGTTSALVGGGNGRIYRVNGVDTASPTTVFVVLGDGLSGIGASSFDVVNGLVYVGSEEGVIYAVEYPFP